MRCAFLALLACVEGFQLPRRSHALHTRTLKIAAAAVAVPDPPKPGPLALKLGGKSINLTGLWFGASMTIWVIALYPLVLTCAITSRLFDPKKRRPMDFMVWLWARCSMLTCLYRPKVTGKENLPEKGVPVLIVPNHCSYLDILTLSAFMPRPFKYISKIEILRIPFIGWAMGFAGHIALRRADRRSQLETFKDTVESLKNGNSVVAFAEGTRSADGTLQKFGGGPSRWRRPRRWTSSRPRSATCTSGTRRRAHAAGCAAGVELGPAHDPHGREGARLRWPSARRPSTRAPGAPQSRQPCRSARRHWKPHL